VTHGTIWHARMVSREIICGSGVANLTATSVQDDGAGVTARRQICNNSQGLQHVSLNVPAQAAIVATKGPSKTVLPHALAPISTTERTKEVTPDAGQTAAGANAIIAPIVAEYATQGTICTTYLARGSSGIATTTTLAFPPIRACLVEQVVLAPCCMVTR
jgi:hypothetical protein